MIHAEIMRSARRAEVLADYSAAVQANRRKFLQGDDTATAEYIYDNQIKDAEAIVREFKDHNRRVISITKKTKVGMDGLMIEIATRMTTDPDDAFTAQNVLIITGMSNAAWQRDMKAKAPNCFKDQIFHHGQLKNAALRNLRNGLIMIDEIDTGNKEFQVLHTTLRDAGLLDVAHMEQNNNRFIFVSATMIKELHDLADWSQTPNLCARFQMTVPANYIGHGDFLERGILQEFYPMDTDEAADQWIREDILANYDQDFRIHIARVNKTSARTLNDACRRNHVAFYNHTSDDRLGEGAIKALFNQQLTGHVVIGIKGFFRRANLIPNKWKLRIGATHERCTKVIDNSVQIQGLPGRMSGYWRDVIEGGHRTGPHRTSLRAVKEYEEAYADPFGDNSYRCAGFTKKQGVVTTAHPTMLAARNIAGLQTLAHNMKTLDLDPIQD